MLCSSCLSLVQDADKVFTAGGVVKTEVNPDEFHAAVRSKCYFCTRLTVELGPLKLVNIRDELPRDHVIAFDKSVHSHSPHSSQVRLGCKLTPFRAGAGGQVIHGKSFSYGYVKMTLLPEPRSEPLPEVLQACKTAISTSDPAVLSVLKNWLKICTTHPDHASCQQDKTQKGVYPTRLMDLAPDGEGDDLWRLIKPAEKSIQGPYITLSHRWGKATFKLNRDTETQMLTGMPVSILPGLYQDVVRVAKQLGCRYLWIDSTCIFQDGIDFQKEATRMAEVYGNAICNISALLGREDSLFVDRDPDTINSDAVDLDREKCALERSYKINDEELWRGELVHMPLTKRGWVLQEEVLAPRTIYFGSKQVLWDCLSRRACETYPHMHVKRPLQLANPQVEKHFYFLHDEEIQPITGVLQLEKNRIEGRDRTSLYRVWTKFISHYSQRLLTYPEDKLLAVSGVSKLFGHVLDDKFEAGLWRDHLMDGLLWYVRPNKKMVRPEYRAPSWSWASCDGYIEHEKPFTAPWIVARALSVDCETVDGNPFGAVVKANMVLQAPCIPLQIDKHDKWHSINGKFYVPTLAVKLDGKDDIGSVKQFTGAIIRTTAFRLADPIITGYGKKILLAAHGIVLDKLADKKPDSTRPSRYRRVGFFTIDDRQFGTLTPRWAPEGCKIFRKPVISGSENGADVERFDFDDEQVRRGFTTLEII